MKSWLGTYPSSFSGPSPVRWSSEEVVSEQSYSTLTSIASLAGINRVGVEVELEWTA